MDRIIFQHKMDCDSNEHYQDIEIKEIIKKSIEVNSLEDLSFYGFNNLLVIAEELGELQNEIFSQMRNKGTKIGLIEELADVALSIKYIQQIFDISDDTLNKAMDIKLKRESDRLE